MSHVLRVSDAIAQFGLGVVRNNVERGKWQKPCRGVVVLHNGPLTDEQLLDVLLASAVRGAVLGGLTALQLDKFKGFDAEALEFVLPSGARTPSYDGDQVVHWSTQLDHRDVHPNLTPPRTRTSRSLIDAASWQSEQRRARAIIIAGLQQGLTSTRHLRESLTRRGPCRHRGLIVESVLDAAGGIQSLPERDFDEVCRWSGLPPPSRQRPVQGADRRFYLDAAWDDIGMAVEVHGIPHLAVERWDADLFRANEVVISGERLLAFSSYAVRREQRVVGGQLIRMAQSLGWTGTPTDLSALTPSEQRKRRKFSRRAG